MVTASSTKVTARGDITDQGTPETRTLLQTSKSEADSVGASTATITAKPATTAGKPTTTAGKPTTTAGKPATTAGKPATTAGKPTTTAGKPATTAAKTTSTTTTPATSITAGDTTTIKVPVVLVTQTISEDFLDPKNDAKKQAYEASFLKESGAGEGSSVAYKRVEAGGRRLAGVKVEKVHTGATEASWTLAYEDTSAAKNAADRIVSAEFTLNLSKAAGVELSAPKAQVVEEMEIVVPKKSVEDESNKPTQVPVLSSGLRLRAPNAAIEV